MTAQIELNKVATVGEMLKVARLDRAAQRGVVIKAVLVFVLGLLAGGLAIFGVDQAEVRRHKQEASSVASLHGHLLEQQLVRSMSATYALAALVRKGKGELEDFESLAAEMLPMYGGVSALQLAPNGVIRRIVPMEGHQAALGHDLLADPERNREAFLALKSRTLTLAGPFELKQGGLAVVGRLPVFLDVGKKGEHFWGFATALFRIPDLLEASALTGEGASGNQFELNRILTSDGRVQNIWRSTESPLVDPVSVKIAVPNGEWVLNVVRVEGWHMPLLTAVGFSVALLVISALLAVQVYHMLRQPLLLSQLVASRTAELNEANQSLQTEIFEHWQAEMALRENERLLEQRVEARTRELAEANASLLAEQRHHKEMIEKLANATDRRALDAEER